MPSKWNVYCLEMPTETPTLLHFAAYYNLQKLASALLRCPGSQEALAMKNSNGKIPVDVAKMRSNAETAELLEGHQVSACSSVWRDINPRGQTAFYILSGGGDCTGQNRDVRGVFAETRS